MSLEQAKVDQRDAELREWKAKLERLQTEIDRAPANARIRYDNELQSLREQFNSLQIRWTEVKANSSEAWQDLKGGLSEAWDKFKKSMHTAPSRFDNKKSKADENQTSLREMQTPTGK